MKIQPSVASSTVLATGLTVCSKCLPSSVMMAPATQQQGQQQRYNNSGSNTIRAVRQMVVCLAPNSNSSKEAGRYRFALLICT